MVFDVVDAQHVRLLECPRSNIAREVPVARLDTPRDILAQLNSTRCWKTHLDTSLLMNSSLKISTPPNHVARALPTVWKPVTRLNELPAHNPSPDLSAASTTASAPESLSPSDANACGGAFSKGTRNGLFPSACGTPENHTGLRLGEMMWCARGGSTGMTVAGVSRLGKCEMRGVPGGGRMRENSDAREVRGVCFDESASRRLVFLERRETRDWGVMSPAKPVGRGVEL